MRVLSLCVLCGALVCGCSTKNATKSAPSTTTSSSTTTTTVVPTTVPTTTTTVVPTTTSRPRSTTTTTEPAPEPVVQGTAVQTDAGDDIETWLAIGRCEQPGNGWGGVRWDHPGPRWGGGLGIYMENGGTWAAFGGREYAPTPGQATPMQQIQVARNVRARYGYGAWGCGRKLGLG